MKFKTFKILSSKTLLSYFAFLTLCTTFTNAQSDQELDSLTSWSYEELLNKYDDEAGVNNSKALLFGKAYLKKARFDKDTIKIANAYTQLALVSEFKITLEYCDSIIELTKNSPSKEYPGWGHIYKGLLLFNNGKYEDALNHYSEAYKAALNFHNEEYLFYLNDQIGQIKLFWGNPTDAVKIYKNQLEILSQSDNFRINDKISTIFKLSNAFLLDRQIDSASFYNLIGIVLVKQNPSSSRYPLFLEQSGEILLHQTKFQQSKDSLLKTEKLFKDRFTFENTYNLLGQVELKLLDTVSAVNYFSKADSLVDLHQDYTPDTKNIHSFLRDYYLRSGDIENFNIYDTKLKKTDSILTETYKLVNRKLIEDFEIPKIINEKDQTIKSIQKNSIISENVILFVGIVAIFGVLFVISYIKRNKKKSVQKKNVDPLKSMSPEVVDKIMKQLDRFEKNKKFTAKNISTKSLAKKFNTNSSYLSKVVNNKKKQHFSNYISDLRINYCIEQLDSNKKYHLFDIKSLANEFGYKNSESFSKAFIKKTGTTPSSYIQNLGNSKK